MKTLSGLTFAIALATTACSTMKPQLTPGDTSTQSFKWRANHAGQVQYLVYLPPSYDARDSQRWPLMLFLHGAGERGTDIRRVGIHGPLSLVKRGTNFPCIIVAPLCLEGRQWENEPLFELLDHAAKKFTVDTNRVYLTGLSMGGYGTWRLALAQPERFAAIAPVCGGGSLIDVILGGRDHPGRFRSLAVWAFHGAKDDVVPRDESERMVEALKEIGVKEVKLTVYPEANHDSWTQTYSNPAFYDWLLQHRR